MQSSTQPYYTAKKYICIQAQGSVFSVKPYDETVKHPAYGGARGVVTQFSRASRKRMLDTMARLRPGKRSFITLTYPARFPDERQAKQHLRAFFERLRRYNPDVSAIWRMEYQRRGAPHFHIMAFDLPYIPQRIIHQWWCEIVAEYVDGHKPRVEIKAVRSNRGAMHYIAKYMSKENGITPYEARIAWSSSMMFVMLSRTGWLSRNRGDWLRRLWFQLLLTLSTAHICTRTPGRFWGVHQRKCLPYAPKAQITVRVDTKRSLYDIKAAMRRVWSGVNRTRDIGASVYSANPYKIYDYACAMLYNDLHTDWYSYDTIMLKGYMHEYSN